MRVRLLAFWRWLGFEFLVNTFPRYRRFWEHYLCYVVRGKGVASSLNSAAHGAGRRMSRTKAKQLFSWDVAQRFLRERGVTLLSAGLDEVPMAYKDIDEVMAAQSDLVEPLARFEPRLVKMAPSGEPPED